MKLIVGLGNPGKEYENTRHNAGFVVVDELLNRLQISASSFKGFKYDKKFGAEIAKNGEVMLVKPQLFMNRSGEVVHKIIDYYFDLNLKAECLNLDWLYVVHDDLDIALGQYKLKLGSGPKVHNGVNSIRKALGTDIFWYGRVGVDARDQVSEERLSGRDYVLKQLSREERVELDLVAGKLGEEIREVISA